MKIALAVPRITQSINDNINIINALISEACANGASFILLPEATLTGLANNDSYEHDINLSISIKHQIILDFCDRSKKNNIWLSLGFFENDNGCIYDSAVLINPNGEIAIHHRRINPQWRAKNLPSDKYSEGVEIQSAITPCGKTAIAICGDLFDDRVISMLGQICPDLILFPFARCFFSEVKDAQKEWDETEKYEYINQVKRTGAVVAMSNYIGTTGANGNYFGGAFIINANGEMLASLPLFQEGILYYEFKQTGSSGGMRGK